MGVTSGVQAMQRATTVVPGAVLRGRVASDTVTLSREARWRRRLVMTTDAGRQFLLDLAEATYLAHGDALELDDGTLVAVLAEPEDLLEIHAHDAASFARIAWHIGNRHTAAEITRNAITIKPDHVLEAMVTGLGGHVRKVRRPWEPEGGAYGGKGPLQSGHAHEHTHEQDDGHPHPGDHHHHDH